MPLLGHILVPVLGTVNYLFTLAVWIILLFATEFGVILVLLLRPDAKDLYLGLMWALGLKGDEQYLGGKYGGTDECGGAANFFGRR